MKRRANAGTLSRLWDIQRSTPSVKVNVLLVGFSTRLNPGSLINQVHILHPVNGSPISYIVSIWNNF